MSYLLLLYIITRDVCPRGGGFILLPHVINEFHACHLPWAVNLPTEVHQDPMYVEDRPELFEYALPHNTIVYPPMNV